MCVVVCVCVCGGGGGGKGGRGRFCILKFSKTRFRYKMDQRDDKRHSPELQPLVLCIVVYFCLLDFIFTLYSSAETNSHVVFKFENSNLSQQTLIDIKNRTNSENHISFFL